MEGLLFFRVYPSDGFRFIFISDGNPSHEFPVLDENPSSNMNSAIDSRYYKHSVGVKYNSSCESHKNNINRNMTVM
jgi:hypothetical protein